MRFGMMTRVTMAMSLVLVTFVAVLLSNLQTQRELQRHFVLVTGGYVPLTRQIDDVVRELQTWTAVVSESDEGVLREAMRASATLFPFPRQIERRLGAMDEHLARLRGWEALGEDEDFLGNMQDVVAQLRDENRRAATQAEALQEALVADRAERTGLQSALRNRLIRMERRVSDVARLVEQRVDRLAERTVVLERSARARALWGVGAMVAAALLAAWVVARGLRPVRALTRAVQELRRGTYRRVPFVGARDEVGELVQEFNAMADAIEERDRKVQAQTRALEEAFRERLEAQKSLVEAERLAALGEMSSRITHEIRNPLSSISLNVEMLRDEVEQRGDLDPEFLSMLDAVDREVQRLTALTEQYLSAARFRPPELGEVALGRVARDVVRQIDPRAERAGVRMALDAPVEVSLRGDEAQIRQLLWNLLQNAIEALETLERRTEMRVRVIVREEGEDVLLQVDDSGAGWPEEVETRIFEPFFSTKAQGTGLGLGISRDIVRAHGGQVRTERRGPLGGASFRILLPRQGPAPGEAEHPEEEAPGGG